MAVAKVETGEVHLLHALYTGPRDLSHISPLFLYKIHLLRLE